MAGERLGWKVTSQVVDQTTTDTAGNVVVGSYIYYITNEGNRGVVFVDNDHLTTKHVQETIRADAKRLDDIGRLAEGFTQAQ